MTSPLSKAQHMLRGRKIEDMTVAQLRTWIDACDRRRSGPTRPRKPGEAGKLPLHGLKPSWPSGELGNKDAPSSVAGAVPFYSRPSCWCGHAV